MGKQSRTVDALLKCPAPTNRDLLDGGRARHPRLCRKPLPEALPTSCRPLQQLVRLNLQGLSKLLNDIDAC